MKRRRPDDGRLYGADSAASPRGHAPELIIKEHVMTTPDIAPPTLSDRMKTVKAAWDAAPSGPKKDAAHAHYVAAGKAMGDKKDQDAIRELDAAVKALS
jgi:hypothetical protein